MEKAVQLCTAFFIEDKFYKLIFFLFVHKKKE